MSVDKLVDSTQLDADLTSVANAIRTKGGTSASLAFPAEFVSAIQAIPSGGSGEWTSEGIANGSEPSGSIVLTGTRIAIYSFYNRDNITNVSAPNATTIENYAFAYCGGLEIVRFDSWEGPASASVNTYIFSYAGSASKTIIVLPSLVNFGARLFNRGNFKAIDIGPNSTGAMGADTFYHNTGKQIVETLILRRTSGVVTANTTDAINGLRNVYVPSALITAYEQASNWSTRVTGGYITFHAIEGSIYETQYADGTPITLGGAA